MDERKYITLLKTHRQQLADEGLHKPDQRTEFEYGRAVGVNHGLRLAEELLLNMLKDEKESDL